MIFLYIICAVIAVVILCLLLRVRLVFEYGEKLKLHAGILFVNIDLLSLTSDKKTAKKKSKSSAVQTKGNEKKNILSEFTEDMSFSDFLELLKVLLHKLIEMFKRHLYVRLKKFTVIVGDKDPAKSAIQFGIICQSCAYLFELLECNTKLYPLEKSEVSVLNDFDASKTEIEAKIIIKLRIIHVLGLVLSLFFEFIKLKESKNSSQMKGKI